MAPESRGARSRQSPPGVLAALLLAAVGVAVLGVGCGGNTDAPTNVGAHSAQLNGHGQANDGPAFSYFEYWKTADPANTLKTPTRNWPAGAQGPISERPQHLSQSSAYSYRLCGADQGKAAICTSTKQFTTGVARSRIAYNSDTETWEFENDPGVNSDLHSSVPFCNNPPCDYVVFVEHYPADGTSGSQIVAPECSEGGTIVCRNGSPAASIKLGDLDDVAEVQNTVRVTVNGGSGDDSLDASLDPYLPTPATLTGGSGRDVLITGPGNDTINARSANFLDPDIDASISCGPGDDTVIADRSDPISAGQNGCEHVSKS